MTSQPRPSSREPHVGTGQVGTGQVGAGQVGAVSPQDDGGRVAAVAGEAAARRAGGGPTPGPPRRRSGGGTALDMVRSIALVLLPVAVIALVAPWPGGEDVAEVDVAAVAADLSTGAGYPLPVPDVPDGWRATDARFKASGPAGAATWHVGYATPDGRFAGLDVTRDGDAGTAWRDAVTRSGAVTGERDVAGLAWRVTERPEAGRRGLDGTAGDGALVAVEGSAGPGQLAVLLSAAMAELDDR